MKHTFLTLFLLAFALNCFGQFPPFNSKLRSGIQTTAQGLVSYSSSRPTHTPNNFQHNTNAHCDTLLSICWVWDKPATEWTVQGLFAQAATPDETVSAGGLTYRYSTGFWLNTSDDVTHYFDHSAGIWRGFGSAGAADSLSVLQDSIVVLYALGNEISRDTIGYPEGVAAQTLSISGDTLSISGGNSVLLPIPTPPDLSPYATIIALQDTAVAIRGDFPINTDSQTLSTSGDSISISGGNSILSDNSTSNEGALSVGAGTSTTALILSNTAGSDTITLAAGSNVTITENTSTGTITISSSGGGGSGSDDGNGIYDGSGNVPNGTVAETDGTFRVGRNTTFLDVNSTSGNTELSASGAIVLTGGSNGIAGKGNVTLSNETGEQARLSLAEDPANGNNTVSIRPRAAMSANWTMLMPLGIGSEGQFLGIESISGSVATTTWANSPSSDDNQTLSLAGDTLSIENGNSVVLPIPDVSGYATIIALQDTAAAIRDDFPVNTDNQTLSIAGNNINISGGNTIASDNNIANEGSLSVGAGTATTALIQSNTVGSTPVTLTAGSNVTISENTATGTITISSSASGDDGDGIYDGSGTVPNGTVAETTGSFRVGRNTNYVDVNSTSGDVEASASNTLRLTGGSVGISSKGDFFFSNETGEQARLVLAENPANGSNNLAIRPPANMSSNWTLILPATAGAEDDILTITNVTGSTVTTAWASAGSSGTTELADQYTIVGNGSFGNEFRVDTFVVGTVALVNNSYVAALEHADILFANVPTIESFYVSGDTVFLETSDSLYFAQLPSATPLSAGYGINIASNVVSVDTSLVSTVSNVANNLQTSINYADSLFATAQTVDSFYLYGDTLFLVLSDDVFFVVLDSVSSGLTWLKPELEAGNDVVIGITNNARLILNMGGETGGLDEAIKINAPSSSDEHFNYYIVLTSPSDSVYFKGFDNGFLIEHFGQALTISSTQLVEIRTASGDFVKIKAGAHEIKNQGKGAELLLLDKDFPHSISIKSPDTLVSTSVIELPQPDSAAIGKALIVDAISGGNIKTKWGTVTGGGGGGGGNSSTVLGVDRTTTSGSFSDVTDLSVPISSTGTYWFKFNILFEASIGDPRYDIALNGPTKSSGAWAVSLPGATIPVVNQSTYNATTATLQALTGFSTVEGIVTFTATGTLIARYKTEAGEPLVIKAGSFVEYIKIL